MKQLLNSIIIYFCTGACVYGQIKDKRSDLIFPSQQGLPAIGEGKWIIAPTYSRMAYLDYEPELFPVTDKTGKWGYVNIHGEVIIPFQYTLAYAFSEGLAAVLNNEGLYGYIGPDGELKIPYQFSYAGRFRSGHAVVLQNGKNHLIDKTGTKTTEEFTDMEWLKDGFIAFKQGAAYGIKDVSGKLIKAPFFTDYFPFSEGLAGIKVQGKWGFMDDNFNLAIKPKYTQKLDYSFYEGTARFKLNGKVGLIDKNGIVVLPAKYDDLLSFGNGLGAFVQNEKWGYINPKGEVIIEAQYYTAYNFRFGMAVVKDYDLKTHLIDVNNNKIISDVSDIIVYGKDLYGVNINGQWGLYLLDK